MFTIMACLLFVVLVALATGLGLLSVRAGRKVLMLGCVGLILVFGSGCNAPKKCMVPGCAGLHRGVWEMDHQIVAQKIKSGQVNVSVGQWLKARAATTPELKGWKDDDLHLKYYIKGYQIKDQRKAGWEDEHIFLTDTEIKKLLK